MMSVFLTIWLLHLAALVTPGANVLLVSQLSASGNARSAALAAVGVAVGAALWSSAAVLGVDAVFTSFPALRLSVQVAGALYLIYIAVRLCRSQPVAADRQAAPSRTRAFRLGLLTNLSNPKSALFFGSVFSTALPAHPTGWVLVAAVTMVVANALGWHLLLAYLFSRKAVQAGYARQRNLFARLAGAVVGALGLSLLVASVREARR